MKAYIELNDYKKASIYESNYEEYVSENSVEESKAFLETAINLYHMLNSRVAANELQSVLNSLTKEKNEPKNIEECTASGAGLSCSLITNFNPEKEWYGVYLKMNKLVFLRLYGLSIALSLLILFSASIGWAQSPLLKIVEIPKSGTPMLRADGLLTSHWTQEYPYNQFCPRDPMNGNAYSYAGCPAIAMGQIINYLRTTEGTRFSDNDDYAHHYAGRNYTIDDDWATLKFPSFPLLNEMLDSIDAVFERGENLTDELAAALVFACGTALTQVYTSEGSGTFYVDQAFEAYQRFGFTDCVLFRDPDSVMYATLISNLQAGYPAHLAVENPAGTVGHNVVVDGYRESDGKFHINFGYGGTLDNWYDIPDPNFYYGMTKVEGIILNIIPTSGPLAVHESVRQQPLEVYPNPVSDVLYLKNLSCERVDYSVFNILGQEVATGTSCGTISIAELQKGLYFLQIKENGFSRTAKFVVK